MLQQEWHDEDPTLPSAPSIGLDSAAPHRKWFCFHTNAQKHKKIQPINIVDTRLIFAKVSDVDLLTGFRCLNRVVVYRKQVRKENNTVP